MPEAREVLSSLTGPRPAAVFPARYVQDPVQLAFDAPVIAGRIRRSRRELRRVSR